MPGLPKIDPFVVDAITDMLVSEQGMLRPPEKAAALLALIVQLHNMKEPFPARAEVAKHINASVPTVDAALSTRLDEGYITQAIETARGNVQRRNSARRLRYYIPSKHLLSVAGAAKDSPRKAAPKRRTG
jgi:hypothetical protein